MAGQLATQTDDAPFPKRRPSERRSLGARSWISAALLLLLGSCRFGAPDPRTEQARDILNLYQLFVWGAIAVGGVTYALILWAAVRYRRRTGDGDELPRQFRYNVPLEITYTLIPVLIVVGLFLTTFRTGQRVDRITERPAVVLEATGFQWQWRFSYPDHGITVVGTPGRAPTIVLPVGETVRVRLAAADVIHAFFVPEFLFKRDAIPGTINQFDLVIPEPGRFRGACAEYCGLDHDAMTFFIEAVPGGEFRAWLEERGGGR